MRNLHSTLIRATKKIINQRLKRTNSPDARRAPHTIDSPFNIPHPHAQTDKPALYILVKTTPQGILKKVSLPVRDESGHITSLGDAAGIIACSCDNPSDPSENHNTARLIAHWDVTLKPKEHYVSSPLIFPNILIQEPLENTSTNILVKLPDHVSSVEQMTREQILEILHEVFNNFGSTEVTDNIYTERFTTKALGIRPTAPTPTPPPGTTHQDPHQIQTGPPSAQRTDLSKSWTKGHLTKSDEQSHHQKRHSQSVSASDPDTTNQYPNNYDLPTYIDVEPIPPAILWTTQGQIAPAMDVAFLKWNPNIDLPTEKIKPHHKAIIFIPDAGYTAMTAVSTDHGMSMAIANIEIFAKTNEDAGRIRVGMLNPNVLRDIDLEHIDDVPGNVIESIQSGLLISDRAHEIPRTSNSGANSREPSITNSYTWDRYDIRQGPRTNQPDRRPERERSFRQNSPNERRNSPETLATCPLCKAMFATATATLQHIQAQHQDQSAHQGNTRATENTTGGKPTILKTSQYQDNYIHISLPNDEAQHFFTATAQTSRDPRTNTIETRYIAPRFPESILAIEDLVAFKNMATKEFNCWFKAYLTVTTSKQLGSYRTYAQHNIGLENSYISLMIQGQKDKIVTLKANSPALKTTKISELNEHLVATWFHNQRVYCLQSRIEWTSWYNLCFTEQTAGREIFERVNSRLASYPTAMETLKTVSSFIEHIVTSLLPIQVPYAQRRQEIINMHTAQLNSAVPTVDFTRQHIDSHAMELKFLHPTANSATPLTPEEEARLQTNIIDELLHEILAGTPFNSRLHQLYLPNPQYQDIRKVPKAKILEDLARIISTDRATGQNLAVSTMQTSTHRAPIAKEPARCTACAALNVPCSPTHCKTHQPVWTTSQAKTIQRSNSNPFVKKSNCNECQEDLIIRGLAGLKTNLKNKDKPKRSNSNSKTRTTRRSRSSSRSRSRDRRSRRQSSPPTQSPARGKDSPRIRTILRRSSENVSNEPTKRDRESPPRSQEYRERQSRTDNWNYARRSPERQRSNSRTTGWRQRSPSPRDSYGYNKMRTRSKSPRSGTRRYSPYRSRSQSYQRPGSRNQEYRSRFSSQEHDTRGENTGPATTKTGKQE